MPCILTENPDILEFRVKTTEIAIGLANALTIGATLGLGIYIHT